MLAAAWSVACVALATWWLLDPSVAPLPAVDDPVSLLGPLDARAGAWVCLGGGVAGVVASAALWRFSGDRRRSRRDPKTPLGLGGLAAILPVVGAPDIQPLCVLGYVMALLGLPALAVLLLAGARHHRRNWLVLAVIAAAVAVGVVTGQVGGPTLELLDQMRGGFAKVGPRPLVVAFLAVGGLLFAGATVSAARATRDASGPGATDRLQRVGRVATIVAALGPVPYGLVRLTWATPWPQGLGPGHEGLLDHGIRVFGICLGLSALAGAWLTLGLISRWGERWPAWLPGLRGRPVPVLAAVIPAGLVSVALCSAAVSLVVMGIRQGDPGLPLVIPAPIWGPALVVATYAYYRRRTDSPDAMTEDGSTLLRPHAGGQIASPHRPRIP